MPKVTVENFGDAIPAPLTGEDLAPSYYPMTLDVSVLHVLQWLRTYRPDLFQTILRPTLPEESNNLDARGGP